MKIRQDLGEPGVRDFGDTCELLAMDACVARLKLARSIDTYHERPVLVKIDRDHVAIEINYSLTVLLIHFIISAPGS